LPLNGAGVSGAALADLRLPTELLRGFSVLARTAGLIGQLAEELAWPVGRSLYHALDVNSYARPLTEPAAHEP
jgi:citrate synthase